MRLALGQGAGRTGWLDGFARSARQGGPVPWKGTDPTGTMAQTVGQPRAKPNPYLNVQCFGKA